MFKVGEWNAGDVRKIPANLDSGSNVCAILVRVRWERVWLVVAVRDDRRARIERTARTVTELRRLLDTARADKAVWHISYKDRRELVGDKPTHCDCGTEYRTAGSWPTPHDWLPCTCGGHFWWQCRDCKQDRVEPPAAYDCNPRTPQRRH
ncbi:MAG TPA: hypothetical protein VFT95_09055 [Micromonosporaceae bacterium]|nr:hypothetical protein [Micromonosporaceae bacterium]